MDADRPIKTPAEDRLGFSPVARHLAQVILDQSAKDGLVFGIEGEWGSGKSTLINLAIVALRGAAPAPEIIEYSPWLVGSRDDLLAHLFDELAAAAGKIDPVEPTDIPPPQTWRDQINKPFRSDAHYRLKRKERLKKQLSGKLQAFGAVAGGLSKLIKSSAALGVPYTETAGTIVERAGEGAKSLFSSASITKRKAEIVEALKLLSRRIVVFVDDLDRLEPREASEVLRLIRAVADFPNVIYILSYDVDVVSKTLQKAIQLDDGRAFLEKIVQVSFKVPRPEAFDLRRWFHDEVRGLFADEIAQASNLQRPVVQRLARAIDVQGGRYLTTPRDVVRALNSLRLHAIPVRTHIDVADMVWLQLVRIGNPAFYAWIEEYLTETSAIYRGASVTGHVAAHTGQRLNDTLASENLDIDYARIELSTMLPGVMRGFANQNEEPHRVFNNLGREVFNRFIVERRLGSPEHYRYYFAFAQPGGALRDDQVDAFLQQAQQDRNATISLLEELGRETRPQGGVMAELMFERLIAAVERIPEAAVPNIMSALSDILDDVALSTRDGDWGQHRSWGAAEHLVEKLMRKVTDPAIRRDCIVRLFTDGRAIGWQTSLLRSEIFAHGHYGDREEPQDQRLLTPAEFQQALASMISRYNAMPPERLRAVPNLVSLLYGWKQAARSDDARRWVEANTQTDEDLLTFLSRARGWSSSNGVVQYPLKRQDLSNFLDYDSAVRRVEAIAGDKQVPAGRRQLAAELLIAVRQGQRD
jgi:predicted KAP-like P-loop ATPase